MPRQGRLHLSAFMRGNDAMYGLVCDTVSFTLLQEHTAGLLGVHVGAYTLHVGSMHVSTTHLDRVAAILAEDDQLTGPGHGGPPVDVDNAVRRLRRAVDLGVNHLDTADAYGPHTVEDLIRRALHPCPHDLVIATIGGHTRQGPQPVDALRPHPSTSANASR